MDVGTSWENQVRGTSSTYGKLAEATLKAGTPQIQKFLKSGNADNYQTDFLDSIFNQFHPTLGGWGAYADQGGAYTRGKSPWTNLENLSTRFMGNYDGPGSPATRAQFSFLKVDPTNSRRWNYNLTTGNPIPFYENMSKERDAAHAELTKFFNDRQGVPTGDPRFAAAKGMDNFQK